MQGRRRSEDAAFTPEAPADTMIEVDGWKLRIVGRVHGLYGPDRGRSVVEEIKTSHFRSEPHHFCAHERIERFRWQARICAFCLFPAGDAHARLPFVDWEGSGTRSRVFP
ncbi:MAG TPA: hypothetical protein P5234_15725 [Thermoanaerobaculaceae bacterium]|nr:hypothetical protein [Thermoanaerobaculaceae bacterium]HRS17685.1 hypothetical protein [Thermoanaerobaculaceae bacterium]